MRFALLVILLFLWVSNQFLIYYKYWISFTFQLTNIPYNRLEPSVIISRMSLDTVPKDLRGLRACLVCSLIKTFDQFEYDGCDNCDEFLRMKNNKDNVYDCTSNNFDGMIAVMSPEDSWVCKWQRISRFTKGVYAISVSGRLPAGVIREMKSRGLVYRPRDTSQR